MADPRFFDNRGPFSLSEVCARIGATVPDGTDAARPIVDVASLAGAVAGHLSFFIGEKSAPAFDQTAAGVVLVPEKMLPKLTAPDGCVVIGVASVHHAFAAVAEMFYPDCHRIAGPFNAGVHPTAKIGEGVELGAGVVVGPGAEIGDRTHVGAHVVIGRGVAIGRDCEIAGNTVIQCAYIGDGVAILPGAQIGQPGFGFASSAAGHTKIPQLGRVIVQDRVEIGACVTIDRGALGDTVIGEGTKIDNLVQIGHNTHIGRHAVIVSQVGISGSCEIGDFVVLAGQVGVSDHAKIGAGARLGGKCGVFMGQQVEPGRDYGGIPAKPVREWLREIAAVSALVKKPKRGGE
jgi:UDP-3-O-[3-hydroxymyristoyl] glucosamine N-acyltransferase